MFRPMYSRAPAQTLESIYHFDSTAGPNNVTGFHFNTQRGTRNGVVRSITYDIRLPFGA